MTVFELKNTLEQRKKGLSYRLWKQGNLCQLLDKYPENPDVASPELAKPKPTMKMPDWMKEKYLIKRGGK